VTLQTSRNEMLSQPGTFSAEIGDIAFLSLPFAMSYCKYTACLNKNRPTYDLL